MTKERINELEKMSIKTSKTETQKEKKANEKDRTEYPRIVGKLRKL